MGAASPPNDAHERGRALEQAVADLFRARGYVVEANVLRRGRSGARYEVDVLARRDDGLVHGSVAVECKNRTAPVDTQVVARARLMRDDIGASEVLIVAPGGWTPAAEAGAAETGVTLWGAGDLARHLGGVAVRALGPAPPAPSGPGLERRVEPGAALRALRAHVGGPLGLRRERLAWTAAAWLPVHELRVALAQAAGRVRPRVRVTRVHGLYEALGGTPLGAAPDPLATVPVAIDAPRLPVRLRPGDIETAVTDALRRRDAAAHGATRDRHASALEALGLPGGAAGIAVEDRRTVWVPVVAGLVARGPTERLVVLDAVTGRVDQGLSDALTTLLHAVVPVLAPDAPV